MDNGALQKEKAFEFKQIVSSTKWKKGKQNMHTTSRSSPDRNINNNQDGTSQLNFDGMPTTATSKSKSTKKQLGKSNFLISEDRTSDEVNEPEQTNYLEQIWNAPPHTGIISPDSVCLRNPGDYTLLSLYSKDVAPSYGPGLSVTELAAAQMNDIDCVDIAPQEISELAINGRNNSHQLDGMMWTTPQYTASIIPAVIAPDYCMNPSNTSPLGQTLVPDNTTQSTSRCTTPKNTTSNSQKEDALFMHYLDDVFYTQNAFYNPADKFKRAWLFSVIKQVKPAYYATLALSERDLLLSSMPQDVDMEALTERLRVKDGYFDLAIQCLKPYLDDAQTLQGESDLGRCVEGLTSILQILYWEVRDAY